MMSTDADCLNPNDSNNFHEMFECIYQNSPRSIAFVDGITHKLIYVNKSFTRLLGKGALESIGLPFLEYFGHQGNDLSDSLLDHVVATRQTEFLAEQFLNKFKLSMYCNFTFWPLGSDAIEFSGLLIQIEDVTHKVRFRKIATAMNESLVQSSGKQHTLTEEAKVLHARLDQAIKAKALFLSAMSHEIRTPLNTIIGCAELLCIPCERVDKKSEYESRIKRNVLVLSHLIEDILDLTKLESGRFELQRTEIDLSALIMDVRAGMKIIAAHKKIDIVVTIIEPVPKTILTDPIRLSQILNNVIGVSIQYMSSGTVEIQVNSDRLERKIRFRVKDMGNGRTPDANGLLVQTFNQNDPSNLCKLGAVGLGLDLSRRLARVMGGNLQLLDSHPIAGNVFEITVAWECIEQIAQVKDPPKVSNAMPRLDGLHILLADDSPDNQFLILRYLTLVGATVDVASDGKEAIDMGLAREYDVILMDIQMPRIDGYEASRQLRSLGYSRSIVALTAHAMNGEIETCLLAGCDGYLTKPVTMRRLIDTIRSKVCFAPPNHPSTQLSSS